jgi:hypothetical protein
MIALIQYPNKGPRIVWRNGNYAKGRGAHVYRAIDPGNGDFFNIVAGQQWFQSRFHVGRKVVLFDLNALQDICFIEFQVI